MRSRSAGMQPRGGWPTRAAAPPAAREQRRHLHATLPRPRVISGRPRVISGRPRVISGRPRVISGCSPAAPSLARAAPSLARAHAPMAPPSPCERYRCLRFLPCPLVPPALPPALPVPAPPMAAVARAALPVPVSAPRAATGPAWNGSCAVLPPRSQRAEHRGAPAVAHGHWPLAPGRSGWRTGRVLDSTRPDST